MFESFFEMEVDLGECDKEILEDTWISLLKDIVWGMLSEIKKIDLMVLVLDWCRAFGMGIEHGG